MEELSQKLFAFSKTLQKKKKNSMTNMLRVYYITRQQRPIKRKGKRVPSSRLRLPPSASPSSGTRWERGAPLSELSLTFSMSSGSSVSFHVSFHAFPISSPVPAPFFLSLVVFAHVRLDWRHRGAGTVVSTSRASFQFRANALCLLALRGSKTFPGTRKENRLSQL